MNFLSVFFSIVLFFWIILGSYVYTCKIQELCDGGISKNEDATLNEKKAAKQPKANEEDNQPIKVDTTQKSKEELKPEEKTLLEKKHIVYFELASTDMIITAEHEAYFKLLKEHLEKDAANQVILTGHTDNVGTPERNLMFGTNRAENVKKFLVQMGLKSEQIKITSKGQDAPIDTNDSEEGKAKNRRVEIEIQK